MNTKRSAIVLLVGLNLFLLAAVLITCSSPPAAFAQSGGRSGDFVAVTAQASGQLYDVFYVLDIPKRQLIAFYPQNTSTKRLQYTAATSLTDAFATPSQTKP